MSRGSVLLAQNSEQALVKLTGEIRYTMGHGLDNLIERLFRQDRPPRIVFDLTGVTAIDSTGLGLLAKAARKAQAAGAARPLIASDNADTNLLLSSMGFDNIFEMVRTPPEPPGELQEVLSCDNTECPSASVILDAHRSLADLNDENRKTFAKIVEMLEKDLDRP